MVPHAVTCQSSVPTLHVLDANRTNSMYSKLHYQTSSCEEELLSKRCRLRSIHLFKDVFLKKGHLWKLTRVLSHWGSYFHLSIMWKLSLSVVFMIKLCTQSDWLKYVLCHMLLNIL